MKNRYVSETALFKNKAYFYDYSVFGFPFESGIWSDAIFFS